MRRPFSMRDQTAGGCGGTCPHNRVPLQHPAGPFSTAWLETDAPTAPVAPPLQQTRPLWREARAEAPSAPMGAAPSACTPRECQVALHHPALYTPVLGPPFN